MALGAAADLSISPRSSPKPDAIAQQPTSGADADAARLPDGTPSQVAGGGRTPQRRVARRSATGRTARPVTHQSRDR